MKHAREDYNRIQDPEGKIPEDEPVMLFRAKDKLFVEILQTYRGKLLYHKAQPAMIELVDQHIELAKVWQATNPTKLPDIPETPHEG